MNNEIKEILDKLKDGNWYDELDLTGTMWIELTWEETHLLLDYITNLQQENKEWEMIFDTFSKRPYAHKYLEEKRKELGNDKIIGLDSEMIYKDYYDYKSRCEKAVEEAKEKIKGYKETIDMLITSSVENKRYEIAELRYKIREQEDLLNILQNGSDSQ